MKITGFSDIGKYRKQNQDAFFIAPNFAILADGMGGHTGGEIASTAAISAVRTHLENSDLTTKESIKDALTEAANLANSIVFELATNELTGMGTTLIIAVFHKNIAYIANVGDSRAYKITADEMRQITKDHTVKNNLIDSGEFTAGQVEVHPQKNYLTRAIGAEIDIEVDIFEIKFTKNDVFLICSDGLYSAAAEFEIEQIIRAGASAEKLCELAIKRGSRDNTTVILVEG